MPSRWRFEGLRELYAVPDPKKPFLILLPVEELQKLATDLENLPDVPAEVRRQFSRQLFARASSCSLDRQGRLVLPSEMCAALGLCGEVVLAGGGSRIEVWPPSRWRENGADEEASFADVARRIGL